MGGSTAILPGYAIGFDPAADLVTNSTVNLTASANALEEFTPAQYASASPAGSVAHFGSTVPAVGGTNVGDLIVSGPYVP